ncbi:hypothetical protein PHYBLDRAFT_70555 [Phycomyces blakesleeanus NRRL 1555(-)]|uniref:Uncharacterized protein n=1 Tax=Phycomyces blakesleeanus (strain ATCC 8743b / DSM 1359 / FGSC 10004 / NBRC 33097 / NRRL 1555) TaxID=763407 RepID=A0A162PKQ5_PHYB8|nr:hypothetical protein PHYBLDRAFT_70555 [Phycomyces blakesleeanus NRRL 1555(-)]OAD69796.1 hypothetical protein PHYBLDRAFT_70555 [Phycomyces blakesleeanus NRRL 1555(-)]|eukprot:XP_018287836.1 hypothetical protein PHYBLDRAFT_70555 [Phycomyces blakesleeanus NRRL 1555(-)]
MVDSTRHNIGSIIPLLVRLISVSVIRVKRNIIVYFEDRSGTRLIECMGQLNQVHVCLCVDVHLHLHLHLHVHVHVPVPVPVPVLVYLWTCGLEIVSRKNG